MKMQVEIESTNVTTRNSKAGKPFRKQEYFLFVGETKYPEKYEMMLDDSQSPFLPGIYEVLPASIRRGKYGPEFTSTLHLELVKASTSPFNKAAA